MSADFAAPAANPRPFMCLGVMANGAGNHIAGWRHPDAASGAHNLDLMIEMARTAERGVFDLLFFADSLVSGPNVRPAQAARFEPLTLLSALARETKHIGLAATANTTYSEPFNIARLFASLDHISGGRAAWNVVTGSDGRAAANFGRDAHLDHDRRYEVAEEYLEVVKGLWDSWDDDAFLLDKQQGRYFDPRKLHRLDHEGRHFKVAGPLNTARTPQGRPVIMQAGASAAGLDFAARTAEGIFAPNQNLEEAQAYYRRLKDRAMSYGRRPEEILVLPSLYYIVAPTRAEALEKRALLDRFLRETDPVGELSWRLGHDLSRYSDDDLVPDLPPSNNQQYESARLMDMARRERMTIRQLFEKIAGQDALTDDILCGTPEDIADAMERKFRGAAADGFIIQPAYFPGSLDDFVDLVIPVLRDRGLVRSEYPGGTLRDLLGLPVPASRWAEPA